MFWSPTKNSPDDKPDFQKQFITVAGVTVSHASFIKQIESIKKHFHVILVLFDQSIGVPKNCLK
jgi:hypothetical protein